MTLRSIPTSFSATAVQAIDARLDDVARDHRVALPLAIESGSRAWGFPSPDSDYDCRFVYTRRLQDYLTPWPARDVIETPLTEVLDVNGWDLGKALQLLLRGNAVIIEWLTSPVVYRGDAEFRNEFLAMAEGICDRAAMARHYLHVGEKYRKQFSGGATVKQKRIFYALRPAAVLRWFRINPQYRTPPMHLPTLLGGCDPPRALRGAVDDLIRRKAETAELGEAALPLIIAEFLDSEFDLGRSMIAEASSQELPEAERRTRAESLFRSTVRRLDKDSPASTSQ